LNQTTLKRFKKINADIKSVPSFLIERNAFVENAEFAFAA
jgi:hypothetical protein